MAYNAVKALLRESARIRPAAGPGPDDLSSLLDVLEHRVCSRIR